jgi:hypothetical protein
MVLNDVIEITSITISPMRNDETEGIGSGQILRAELATPLWKIGIDTPISTFDDGRAIRAIMNDLNRPGQTFEVYDPIAAYPRNDPDGSILGSANVLVDTVSTTDSTVTLKGLPAGYKLAPGDFMQIDYAGRRGFFEVSQAATAGSGGVTSAFRVFPGLPAGITANMTVILKQPKVKCQFMPDSIEYATFDSSNWKATGFRFEAVQKL